MGREIREEDGDTGMLLLLQLLEVTEGFGEGLCLDLCAG